MITHCIDVLISLNMYGAIDLTEAGCASFACPARGMVRSEWSDRSTHPGPHRKIYRVRAH